MSNQIIVGSTLNFKKKKFFSQKNFSCTAYDITQQAP